MNKHKVKFTIFKHIIRLQERTGERLKDTEYARQIGITRQSFASLMEGVPMRIENETIEKLLDFFNAADMGLTPGDFYETTITNTL